MYTLIKQWEDTYFDDMKRTEKELTEERVDLVAQMHALGASHAECAPWAEALDVAIAEQGRYEAWYMEAFNKPRFVYDGPVRRRATMDDDNAHTTAMLAKRDAIRKEYNDKGQPAPDWTFRSFNSRLGPAARIHVNGEYPPSKPYKGIVLPRGLGSD